MWETFCYYAAGPFIFFLHDLGNDPILMLKTYGVIFGVFTYMIARHYTCRYLSNRAFDRRLRAIHKKAQLNSIRG